MKKVFLTFFAILAMFLVASCSFLDDSVESLQFTELPEAALVAGEAHQLRASVKVVGGDLAGTYTLTIMHDGKYTVEKAGGFVADPGFEVKGFEGLQAGAAVGNYILSISMEGITLLHNYRVVSDSGEIYFASGAGTEEKPYMIETAQQLFNIRFVANGSYFKLANDINLTNFKWIAIGSLDEPFEGVLDGNHHRIIGLSNALTDSYTKGSTTSSGIFGDNFGLFGAAAGQTMVQDLEFVDVNIDGDNLKGAAAVIGIWTPRTAGDTVTLSNIQVSGSIKGKDKIAGLIGTGDNADNSQVMSYENFINCTNNATIVANLKESGSNRAAGFIAQIRDNNGTTYVVSRFENCVNNGSITCISAEKQAEAAGLVASLNLSGNTTLVHATVINCANNGALSANGKTKSLTYQFYSGYVAE